jgi:hypothetical protein
MDFVEASMNQRYKGQPVFRVLLAYRPMDFGRVREGIAEHSKASLDDVCEPFAAENR